MKTLKLKLWQIELISIVLGLAFIVTLTAISIRNDVIEEKKAEHESLFFKTIFPQESSGFELWVDRKTRVQYLYKGDAMAPYIDAEGKPILYEGNL